MCKTFESLNKKIEFTIGDKFAIGERVTFGANCKKIKIGFGVFIGNDVYIDVPELIIGDYTTIHKGTTIHGYMNCIIGHNCWIGQFCIIDSIAGTTIGNNVGIGAQSQLWSHIKFGDLLEGCRFNSSKPLIVEDDVWFVGHCIVSPILAKSKSMLLVGGVISKDMEVNHIYAGSPAKDITEKMGVQFNSIPLGEKILKFNILYEDFLSNNNLEKSNFIINIVESISKFNFENYKNDIPVFFINERTYLPTRSELEYKFMKYLLYDKAKFVPYRTINISL